VNPQADRLLEQAAVAVDEKRRRELLLALQRLVHQDVASIELGAPPNLMVSDKRVKDDAVTGEGVSGSFSGLYLQP